MHGTRFRLTGLAAPCSRRSRRACGGSASSIRHEAGLRGAARAWATPTATAGASASTTASTNERRLRPARFQPRQAQRRDRHLAALLRPQPRAGEPAAALRAQPPGQLGLFHRVQPHTALRALHGDDRRIRHRLEQPDRSRRRRPRGAPFDLKTRARRARAGLRQDLRRQLGREGALPQRGEGRRADIRPRHDGHRPRGRRQFRVHARAHQLDHAPARRRCSATPAKSSSSPAATTARCTTTSTTS